MLVPRVSTALTGTAGDVWNAIASALVANGVDPRATLFLVADVQIEHGRTLAGLYNFNVGNVKLSPSRLDGRDYFEQTERNTGQTDYYQSFPTLAAGIASYVYEMVTRRPTAYQAAIAQDADAYARTLIVGESGTTVDGYIGLPVLDDNNQPIYDVDRASAYLAGAIRARASEGRPYYVATGGNPEGSGFASGAVTWGWGALLLPLLFLFLALRAHAGEV